MYKQPPHVSVLHNRLPPVNWGIQKRQSHCTQLHAVFLPLGGHVYVVGGDRLMYNRSWRGKFQLHFLTVARYLTNMDIYSYKPANLTYLSGLRWSVAKDGRALELLILV